MEHHNHTTRDIKALGECPACDAYWRKQPVRHEPVCGWGYWGGTQDFCSMPPRHPGDHEHERKTPLDQALAMNPLLVLSTEQAVAVWAAVHALRETDPALYHLIAHARQLERQLAKGMRCGVCGAFQREECREEC